MLSALEVMPWFLYDRLLAVPVAQPQTCPMGGSLNPNGQGDAVMMVHRLDVEAEEG